ELAATSSSSPTIDGRVADAAGLKNTVAADIPKATAYTTKRCPWAATSTRASAMRARSAATMTVTRGRRSTTTPATGASRRTGAIAAATTPDTPSPDPVSLKTSRARATTLTVSPHWDTVRAVHRRR